ncbi:hypothetical protein NESM_000496300 [Novymonas esmeraldas]|uniref:Calponin-homology (CH) domain-containing protein n=1 Tax=Novymonas esmeraldas TaxID=1808958 RepID=A0AAW0ERV5_9TRYP
MQREVIKWVQSLDLDTAIQNPKRDLATGHVAAEIVARYTGTKFLDVQRLPTGASAATKRDVWAQVHRALRQLGCTSVSEPLVDAVLRREPNAALAVLEHLYEHFTGHTLLIRGLDAVGAGGYAYVQPQNASSTVRLLEVTSGTTAPANGGGGSSLKTDTGNPKMGLFDPLAGGTSLPPPAPTSRSTGRGGAATAGAAYTPPDVAADGSDPFNAAAVATGAESTRAVQHQLALIDNSELAGGASALHAYPRYARPTASNLIHTASGSRKDVLLSRPKYTADEATQRQQHTRIVRQHAVVQRLQEAAADVAAGGDDPANPAGWWLSTASSVPPSPTHNAPPAPSSSGVAAPVSLTALYRGRFYQQADTPATGKSSAGARDVRRGRRDEAGTKGRRGSGASAALSTATTPAGEDRMNAAEDATERGAPGELLSMSDFAGSIGGATVAGPRVVPKLRVNVHPLSLQAALARRSGNAELQERAAELSREHFAKHCYILRSALSDILADVLAAHKQLQRLLDCCAEDGSSEALDNVLGHLIAHREEFPPTCMQAFWQALTQHVDGIVATLQKNPDEYAYLVESLAFAFSRDSAQVPLLHVSQTVAVSVQMEAAVYDEDDAAAAVAALPFGTRDRRSTAFAASSVAGAGHAAAAAAAARRRSLFPGVAPPPVEGEAGSPRRRQSLGEALLTATHRAASVAAAASTLPRVASSLAPRQRAIVDTRDGLPLACAFGLLYRVARKLDVRTAAYTLERYLLRCAKPFLLRRGTVAVREAIARVVSASFVSVAPRKDAAAAAAAVDKDGDAEAAAAAAALQAEDGFVRFLTGTLAELLPGGATPASPDDLASPPPSVTSGDGNAPEPPLPEPAEAPSSPQQQRLRLTYWLVFLHAVADYPCSTDHGVAAVPGVDGPLATCVRRAATVCLTCADVDRLTIGVGLVLEYVERWLPREATSASDADAALAGARDVLALVLPSLGDGDDDDGAAAVGAATPWWATRAAHAWECRLMVLRLCNTLLAHPLFSGPGASPLGRRWRGVVEAAAGECLLTFAKAPSWQLQLALGAVGRSIQPAATPVLTAAWRRLLFSVPVAALPTQLLPYDDAPVHLRLLRPLQATAGAARDDAESGASRAAQQSSKQQQQQQQGHVSVRGGSAGGTGQADSWTLASTADSAESGRPHGGPGAAGEAPLHLVWGHVLSLYAVVPLNQAWNVQGVVDAVLPPPAHPTQSAGRGGASAPADSAAAPPVAPALPLLVLAAALLSPAASGGGATATATATSPFRLSTLRPAAEAESADGDEPSGVFWLGALRRAWPLFQACGVSQESVTRLRPQAIGAERVEEASPSAASSSGVEVGGAGLDVNFEDVTTIVLSLFLRFADDAAVATAMSAAAGDSGKLCASAVRWAEGIASHPSAPTAGATG